MLSDEQQNNRLETYNVCIMVYVQSKGKTFIIIGFVLFLEQYGLSYGWERIVVFVIDNA